MLDRRDALLVAAAHEVRRWKYDPAPPFVQSTASDADEEVMAKKPVRASLLKAMIESGGIAYA